MGKLRRRELIPEDENITATINEPKIVHGRFGRQVEVKIRVIGGEYKGTEFKDWFSFGKDKEDGEEFIPYGGPLYHALAMVEPNIDDVLDDEDLTEKKYQQFIKKAVAKLDGYTVMGRVGVKGQDPKRRNCLQPGSFGPAEDPEEGLDDLPEPPEWPMSDKAAS